MSNAARCGRKSTACDALALDFNENGEIAVAIEQRHGLVQARDARTVATLPRMQAAQHGGVQIEDRTRLAGQARERLVMKNHRHEIARELHIELDVLGAGVQRRHEGGQGVFAGAGHLTAMGNELQGWVHLCTAFGDGNHTIDRDPQVARDRGYARSLDADTQGRVQDLSNIIYDIYCHRYEREGRAVMHSVKMASQMTGLSADTLRAWERRYGAVHPKRDPKGRRVYDAADLARLRLLGQVVALGHPVYRAANLSIAQLEALLSQPRDGERDRHHASLIERAFAAVEAYRPDRCDETLGLAMVTLAPEDAVRHVFSPLLREVGARWRRGELSIAQEHLLTASLERLLMATIHVYQRTARGPRMVFGTLSGERHGLGSLLAAFIAAARGVQCCYLGPELPPDELARAVGKTHAQALGLSLISLTNVHDPLAQIKDLSRLLPRQVEFWLGGAGAGELPANKLPRRCVRVQSFEDYVHRLEILKLETAQQKIRPI
jgi:MerR family transcriptional regulator, light-induced transcriptional regulator